MEPESDPVAESHSDQAKDKERQGEQDEGNPSPPPASEAVALEADHRVEEHTDRPGNGGEDQRHAGIRGPQRVELQGHDGRRDRLHQHVAKIPPEQPEEQNGQLGFGVGQGANPVNFFLLCIGGSVRLPREWNHEREDLPGFHPPERMSRFPDTKLRMARAPAPVLDPHTEPFSSGFHRQKSDRLRTERTQ